MKGAHDKSQAKALATITQFK